MRLIFSIVLFFIVTTNLYAQKANSDEQLKAIDSITFNMKVDKGLITTYQNKKNELYFEIDKSLLSKDLLVVTRLAQIPSDYSGYLNAGSKTAEHVVEFVKQGQKILLKEVSYSNIANINDPISISVSENNFKPILAAFEIKNSDEDSFLINVTSYFMSDSPGFNIIRSYDKENYKIGGLILLDLMIKKIIKLEELIKKEVLLIQLIVLLKI